MCIYIYTMPYFKITNNRINLNIVAGKRGSLPNLCSFALCSLAYQCFIPHQSQQPTMLIPRIRTTVLPSRLLHWNAIRLIIKPPLTLNLLLHSPIVSLLLATLTNNRSTAKTCPIVSPEKNLKYQNPKKKYSPFVSVSRPISFLLYHLILTIV
ncbi:hypothetical protein DM02DRAFT_263567 [Periconia macrospinosa]|uniref:Uncharacterized protein n=1 Tax=Periconia macrospinosa TaxID=97972 RepID=A0A2V1D437_9PLEO|nr:hypothetical protein DM02DRAFT_263567 [Periconia macrospinosa]